MRDQTDDYHPGITDGLAGNPYGGNLPGVDNRSYSEGFDEGFIMRRTREEAAAAPVLPETMGERIRILRKGRRLSLGKLGAIAGCSKSYLWELESGGMTRPSADKLADIAGALGVTIDNLVSGDEGVPAIERMRAACVEAVWEEARGWQSARGFSGSAEVMAGRMERAILGIDVRKLAG